MKQSTFLSIAGMAGMLFGLGFLVVPHQFMSGYGVVLNEGTVTVARSLGAMLLCVGLMNFVARNAEDSTALRAILYGNLAIHVPTLANDLVAVLSHAVASQAWGSVIIHVILSGGFA